MKRIPFDRASWVNESNMEHAQEAIKDFHTRLAKKRRRRS